MTRAARVFEVLVAVSLAAAAIAHAFDGNWAAVTGFTLALAWFVLFTLAARAVDQERAAVSRERAAAVRAFWDGVDAGRAYQATLDANAHRRDHDQEQA